ncbi:hypothetical protein DICPUDRAFT_85378, partial [Dictyostelium purpureum]
MVSKKQKKDQKSSIVISNDDTPMSPNADNPNSPYHENGNDSDSTNTPNSKKRQRSNSGSRNKATSINSPSISSSKINISSSTIDKNSIESSLEKNKKEFLEISDKRNSLIRELAILEDKDLSFLDIDQNKIESIVGKMEEFYNSNGYQVYSKDFINNLSQLPILDVNNNNNNMNSNSNNMNNTPIKPTVPSERPKSERLKRASLLAESKKTTTTTTTTTTATTASQPTDKTSITDTDTSKDTNDKENKDNKVKENNNTDNNNNNDEEKLTSQGPQKKLRRDASALNTNPTTNQQEIKNNEPLQPQQLQLLAQLHPEDFKPLPPPPPSALIQIPPLSTDIIEKAKEDAKIMRRIHELQKKGVWGHKQLQKLPEPPRPKVQWDHLLEEMQVVSEDFIRNRRLKIRVRKALGKDVIRHHSLIQTQEQREIREEENRKKKLASNISKEIKKFWSQIKKLIQYKDKMYLESVKKVERDRQLEFIVGKTEKYSSLLAENLRGPESNESSASTSTSKASQHLQHLTPKDLMEEEGGEDDYQHSSSDSSCDLSDEFVSEEEEQLESEEYLERLKRESDMPLDELLKRFDDEDSEGEDIQQPPQQEEELNEMKEEQMEEEIKDSKDAISIASKKAISSQPTGFTFNTTQVKTKVPFLIKYPLREYQHIGLDWLVSLYEKNLNGILADEMGLGKTIMTISLIAYLAVSKGIWGPHLIVVPSSVLFNWEAEFKKWAPGLKIFTYHGSSKDRKASRKGWSKSNAFHVCITSYSMVLSDHLIFRRKKWVYMILDEAHVIKNFKTQKWQNMLHFNTERRLLLTGTPLQNSLMELWSLMHFLMPDIFQSHREFQDWFSNPVTGMVEGNEEVNEDIINRLHAVLRPFLLRRLKKDVEKQLPAKHTHIVPCSMSRRQKFLYEEFINLNSTQTTLSSGSFFSIINILMQLRKVCNHPDLFKVRPIISPWDTDTVSFEVSSMVVNILDDLPIRNLNLNLLNLDLINYETALSQNDADTILELLPRESALLELFNQLARSLPNISLQYSQPNAQQMLTSCLDIYQNQRNEFQIKRYQETLDRMRYQKTKYLNRPIYGRDLVDSLKIIDPIRDLYSIASKPSKFLEYSDCVLSMIKTPSQRQQMMESIINNYTFLIPKTRSEPITLVQYGASPSKLMEEHRNEITLLHGLQHAFDSFYPSYQRMKFYFPDKRLVQYDCGKLQEMAILLRKLKNGGHRALIFTQMTRMLDIFEEFLNIHGYTYLRLDGSTKIEKRQALTERFNTDPKIFLFILSTRSGGLGLNLTGADTVIFYDTDWNPSMDAQAQDRCHRIGQTREVNIYRLITMHSIEENILKKSNQKRQLDNMVIKAGEFTTEFFKNLKIKNENVKDTINEKDWEKAVEQVEDETDVLATKNALKEAANEYQEFVQDEKSSSSTPIIASDDIELAEAAEIEDNTQDLVEDYLNPIQKFALKFIESIPSYTLESQGTVSKVKKDQLPTTINKNEDDEVQINNNISPRNFNNDDDEDNNSSGNGFSNIINTNTNTNTSAANNNSSDNKNSDNNGSDDSDSKNNTNNQNDLNDSLLGSLTSQQENNNNQHEKMDIDTISSLQSTVIDSPKEKANTGEPFFQKFDSVDINELELTSQQQLSFHAFNEQQKKYEQLKQLGQQEQPLLFFEISGINNQEFKSSLINLFGDFFQRIPDPDVDQWILPPLQEELPKHLFEQVLKDQDEYYHQHYLYLYPPTPPLISFEAFAKPSLSKLKKGKIIKQLAQQFIYSKQNTKEKERERRQLIKMKKEKDKIEKARLEEERKAKEKRDQKLLNKNKTPTSSSTPIISSSSHKDKKSKKDSSSSSISANGGSLSPSNKKNRLVPDDIIVTGGVAHSASDRSDAELEDFADSLEESLTIKQGGITSSVNKKNRDYEMQDVSSQDESSGSISKRVKKKDIKRQNPLSSSKQDIELPNSSTLSASSILTSDLILNTMGPPWSQQEDNLINENVSKYGENWDLIYFITQNSNYSRINRINRSKQQIIDRYKSHLVKQANPEEPNNSNNNISSSPTVDNSPFSFTLMDNIKMAITQSRLPGIRGTAIQVLTEVEVHPSHAPLQISTKVTAITPSELALIATNKFNREKKLYQQQQQARMLQLQQQAQQPPQSQPQVQPPQSQLPPQQIQQPQVQQQVQPTQLQQPQAQPTQQQIPQVIQQQIQLQQMQQPQIPQVIQQQMQQPIPQVLQQQMQQPIQQSIPQAIQQQFSQQPQQSIPQAIQQQMQQYPQQPIPTLLQQQFPQQQQFPPQILQQQPQKPFAQQPQQNTQQAQ